MRPKWTLGPWQAQRESNSIIGIRKEISGFDLAHVLQPEGRGDQKANARLIAAAPEMADFINRVAYEPIGPLDSSAGNILEMLTQEARALLTRINKEEP